MSEYINLNYFTTGIDSSCLHPASLSGREDSEELKSLNILYKCKYNNETNPDIDISIFHPASSRLLERPVILTNYKRILARL